MTPPPGSRRASALVLITMLASAGSAIARPDGVASTATYTIPGGSATSFGSAVVRIGDVDQDGVADFAVGARTAGSGASRSGSVWIQFMRPDGTVRSTAEINATSPGMTGTGGLVLLDRDDEFGASVAALGDIDGDGIPDIAVGAPNDDDTKVLPGSNRGAVYVLTLNTNGTVKLRTKFSELNPGLSLPTDFERFGAAVAFLGDLDGPGGSQFALAVGAPGDRDATSGPGFMRGAVFILFLNSGTPATGPILAGVQKLSETQGTPLTFVLHDADLFGSSVCSLPDMNADGVPDLVVGAPLDDDNTDAVVGSTANRGALYVILLNPSGTMKGSQKISATVGGFAPHLSQSDFFGDGLACLPDLDHSGVTDLAAGASGTDDGAAGAGATWVLLLDRNAGTGVIRVQRPFKLSNTSGGLGVLLGAGSSFGASVTLAGDMNADGLPDLMVGAPGDVAGGNPAAYIVNLSSSDVTDAPSLPPTDFVLAAVAPNPGHGARRIEFSVPFESRVKLGILDVQGRTVVTLADDVFAPGRHSVLWNGRANGHELAAGMYFVRFDAPGRSLTRKIVLDR